MVLSVSLKLDQLTLELCYYYYINNHDIDVFRKRYFSLYNELRFVSWNVLIKTFRWGKFQIYEQILGIFSKSDTKFITFPEFVTLCIYLSFNDRLSIIQFLFYLNGKINLTRNEMCIFLEKLGINMQLDVLLQKSNLQYIHDCVECDDFITIYHSNASLFKPFFNSIERMKSYTLGISGWDDVFYRYKHINYIKHHLAETGSYPSISFCSRVRRLCFGHSLQPYHFDSNTDFQFVPTPIIDLCIKNQPKMIPNSKIMGLSQLNSNKTLLDPNTNSKSMACNRSAISGVSIKSPMNQTYRALCSLVPKNVGEYIKTPKFTPSIINPDP